MSDMKRKNQTMTNGAWIRRTVLAVSARCCLLLLPVAAVSCAPESREIFSSLELRLEFPDGACPVLVRPSGDDRVSFIRNMNTGQVYACPVFVNGTARIQVRKGLYVFGFDADADFGDGRVRRIRSRGYRTPEEAAVWMKDRDTVNIQVGYLNL